MGWAFSRAAAQVNRMDRRRFLFSSLAAVAASGLGSAERARAFSPAARAPQPYDASTSASPLVLERVTTVVPFPRGLAVVGDRMFVLARGRVRGAGGVSAQVDDQAGTLFEVDPGISEPFRAGEVGHAVRTNGAVFARPTSPPFNLWDRNASPPERDRWTDRPYCTLRYDATSRNFFICAFSGIDKPLEPGKPSFSKNLTDALLRYDLRSRKWHGVERHRIESGGIYPHHDPEAAPPPHGWLNGPDNCLPLGRWLYAVAKDNSRLVRYDISAIAEDPDAGPPAGIPVLGESLHVRGLGARSFYGHSALATDGRWLYLAYRTSSVIVRFPLARDLTPVEPIEPELLARFDPYDPVTGHSANLTDMTLDDSGRLYVVSAHPAKVYRFRPDPEAVFDGRAGGEAPWADLAGITRNPTMKCENVLYHGGFLYVTSGDGYADRRGAVGTVYRLAVNQQPIDCSDKKAGNL